MRKGRKANDLAGKVFERLTAIRRVGRVISSKRLCGSVNALVVRSV
jgi:hypothetical protein